MKDCNFVGAAKKALQNFPEEVRAVVGYALYEAQKGGRASSTKMLKGVGSGIIEIVDNCDGDTYRAVYTVRFKQAIYVLHAFKKKAKKGIATPKKEIDLIVARMKEADTHYRKTYGDTDE